MKPLKICQLMGNGGTAKEELRSGNRSSKRVEGVFRIMGFQLAPLEIAGVE
jgi:hypothetical protein